MSTARSSRDAPRGRRAGAASRDPRAVGIVGLGVMGGAIARSLLAAGVAVTGHDLDGTRLDAFAAAGGRAAKSAAEVARATRIVLLLLPSAEALDAVAAGPDGLEAGIRGDSIVVEMSTLAVADKERLRDRLAPLGAVVLDAPISGTGSQVETGDLVIYASGDETAIEAVRDAIGSAAREVIGVGSFGTGSRLKILANHLVAVHVAAAAEALALARGIDVDPQLALRALAVGAGSSRMLEIRGPLMVVRHYQPASMSMRLFAKDVGIIAAAARAVGVETPLFDAAAARFAEGRARGFDDLDTASVHEVAVDATVRPVR